VLILGLDNRNWFGVMWIAGLVLVAVGLAIGAARLSRSSTPSFATGFATLALVLLTMGLSAFVVVAGLWGLVWSGISERTEIALDDGRSIVVVARFWHHCDLRVLQRDGIYVDTLVGTSFDDTPCNAFQEGSYTVEQRGYIVTLTAEGSSMTVRLR
jgi:hypothetical protein